MVFGWEIEADDCRINGVRLSWIAAAGECMDLGRRKRSRARDIAGRLLLLLLGGGV